MSDNHRPRPDIRRKMGQQILLAIIYLFFVAIGIAPIVTAFNEVTAIINPIDRTYLVGQLLVLCLWVCIVSGSGIMVVMSIHEAVIAYRRRPR